MTITNERAELLAQYLNADEERAKKLFETEAEEAVALINQDGFDFTVEELVAFAGMMEKTFNTEPCELSENDLDTVAGGIVDVLVAMGTIYGAVEACKWAANTGYKAGRWIGKKIFK